jgi:hypothetical protein
LDLHQSLSDVSLSSLVVIHKSHISQQLLDSLLVVEASVSDHSQVEDVPSNIFRSQQLLKSSPDSSLDI